MNGRIDTEGKLRCGRCNKLLAFDLDGSVKVVCPRCDTFNQFENSKTVVGLTTAASLEYN